MKDWAVSMQETAEGQPLEMDALQGFKPCYWSKAAKLKPVIDFLMGSKA